MIKALIMDVDGTLTDGKLYISNEGECMKAFSVKDGYAIRELLPKYNIVPIIITGRKSEILERRCEELGITELHQGIHDKVKKMYEVLADLDITIEETAYIGDDLNDLACMQKTALTACPVDAANELKHIVTYICEKKGGDGAVREFVEWMMADRNSGSQGEKV